MNATQVRAGLLAATVMIVVAACLPGGTESTSDNAPSGGDGTSIPTDGGNPGDSSESGSPQPGTGTSGTDIADRQPGGNGSPLPGPPGGPASNTASQASPGDGGIPGVDSECVCSEAPDPGEVPDSGGGDDNTVDVGPEADPQVSTEPTPTLGPIAPDEGGSTGIG